MMTETKNKNNDACFTYLYLADVVGRRGQHLLPHIRIRGGIVIPRIYLWA
jgi:hypothetical protein